MIKPNKKTTVTGQVLKINKPITGKSKKGNEWTKQEVIIEQNRTYNNKLSLSFFGDNVDFIKRLIEGNVYEFMINVYSNEWNDKYYTQVDCWGINELNPMPQEETKEKGFVPVGAEQPDLPF